MSKKITAIKLHQQYASGVRQFQQVSLEKADLEDLILERIDLRGANLNYANLKNINLSNADLGEASLIRAELGKANLSSINFARADLSKANLAVANLTEANLTGASLQKSCLTAANLTRANLNNTELAGAYLMGVDLNTTNLEGASYDDNTVFPASFDPIKASMIKQFGADELLSNFNHVYRCSNKYLGNIISAKYFDDSRPDSDWLRQFKVDQLNQIAFQGTLSGSIDPEQLRLLKKWIDSFTKSCSQTIKDFPRLLSKE